MPLAEYSLRHIRHEHFGDEVFDIGGFLLYYKLWMGQPSSPVAAVDLGSTKSNPPYLFMPVNNNVVFLSSNLRSATIEISVDICVKDCIMFYMM